MAYGKSKDLARRTQSDKVLKGKAFKIASDPKYDGYEIGLALMVYKFFEKKFINQWLEKFKKEKFVHILETMIGVLI